MKPMKIESILCPTDLSPDSHEALRYAVAMARAYNAELILLHCETAQAPAGANRERAARAIKNALVKYAGSADLRGLEWKSVVVACDDTGEAITRQAALLRADMIVMRSRRRPHRAALLGSTAESVSRTAPCPVLVTHSDERDWISDRKIELKRVLVAYDFSDYSELALSYATCFAQEYQSELHLLHVLPPSSVSETEINWHPLGREGAYHQAARRLQRAVPAEAHLWCDIRHVVREGNAYREILDYAEANEIDLICLGAHGAGFGMRTLFGSNVDRVLRQAPCPVLVTRPRKPAMSMTHSTDGVTAIAV